MNFDIANGALRVTPIEPAGQDNSKVTYMRGLIEGLSEINVVADCKIIILILFFCISAKCFLYEMWGLVG